MLTVVAVLLAVAATLVLEGHLARLEARAAAGGDLVPAVAAAVPMQRGTMIQASGLVMAKVPAGGLPPRALRRMDDAIGRTLVAEVAFGEVLTALRLASGGPVAALVPPGMRAVTVTVPLPPGAVASGDRVDVLATFVDLASRTETVVREAEVLAAARASPLDGGGESTTLTLLVSPFEAEEVAHARALGTLSVAIASV
jgi:Flp pilus assembly protein CpaB